MTFGPLLRSVFAVILLAAAAGAQGTDAEAVRQQQRGERLFLEVNPIIEHFDISDRVLYLMGDVQARFGTLYVRCDNLIAWLADDVAKGDRKPAPGEPVGLGLETGMDRAATWVKEIYAEGTVILVENGRTTRADSLFFDLAHNRGIVLDAASEMPITTSVGEVTIRVRADELRVIARNRWEANDVTVTASPFAEPSYHVSVGRIEVIREPPGYARGVSSPITNYSVSATDNVLHLGSIPVLWLPDFVGDSAAGLPFRYVEDVRFGKSSRFGYELGLTVGDDITLEDGERWGHWSVPIDYFTKRGISTGLDLVYQTETYRGWTTNRYQRDEGSDRFYGVPPTKNRGWTGWHHRHLLPGDIQLDLEGNLFSDRGYYPTFFEDLDKTIKPPENVVYLKKAFFNSALSGLGTYRWNDWLTRTEHLPEVRYDLVSEPLLKLFDGTVLLNTTARAGRLRRKIDEDLDVPGRAASRIDIDALLEYPFDIGPLRLTPFAGPRYTFYSRRLESHQDVNRLGFTYGATLSMQMWRDFDITGGLFRLDGLRHSIYPEVTFRQTTGVYIPDDELVFFDDVENYDDVQVIELRLRNVLQTVRYRQFGPQVEPIVDLELAIDYYPQEDRDNDGDSWSNLRSDLLLRFSDDLQFVSNLEFDFYDGDFDVFNGAIGYTPSPTFQAYFGYRHYIDSYDSIFAQMNWRIEEKWMLTVDSSYDVKEGRGINEEITFSRIGPDWVFQIGVRVDHGEDDFSIRINFEPRIFFDPILQPRARRMEPRMLYLGQGLGR